MVPTYQKGYDKNDGKTIQRASDKIKIKFAFMKGE